MFDAAMIAIAVVFFGAAIAYTYACDRL